jgi:putative DNA primase/helicase
MRTASAPDIEDLAAFRKTNNDIVTEDSVALQFAELNGDKLRYCHDAGAWFQWTGNIWHQNSTGLAFQWARELARTLVKERPARVRYVSSKTAFAAGVERFCKSDPAFAVTIDNWDTDPWPLGTPGGTVDLRTAELRPAIQNDFITKSTAVAPAITAECPTWVHFLHEATDRDVELARFLQQWAGYCLTGITREHALVFVFGPGGNGKTVFNNVLAGILADYATTAAMETFASSMSDRYPTDLAMLRGARFVTASETEEGRPWAETRIKAMTGGDRISARFMRQDFFTYKPQFKITIIGNHKPVLRNVDDAARRRFSIVPFVHEPASPDPELEAKQAEWPGILRWMIDGCLDWQRACSASQRPRCDCRLLLGSRPIRTMVRRRVRCRPRKRIQAGDLPRFVRVVETLCH